MVFDYRKSLQDFVYEIAFLRPKFTIYITTTLKFAMITCPFQNDYSKMLVFLEDLSFQ